MKKVLILLSTYNGSKYLSEQLDSLYNQKSVDFHILVRDDGSKDNTVQILNQYKDLKGKMSIVVAENVGASKSFHYLLAEAFRSYAEYDYYAFSDQDDVWLPEKMNEAISQLVKSSGSYKLYYGAAKLVDSNLQDMNRTSGKVINNLSANIVASHSLGCTQVMNNALFKQVAQLGMSLDKISQSQYVPLHDGWSALVAYSLGASVIYDTTPYILYRQHANNVIGGGGSFIDKLKSRIERNSKNRNRKSGRCKLILKFFDESLPDANRRMLKLCANYQESFKDKITLLFSRKMYQYDFITNVGLVSMILNNRF